MIGYNTIFFISVIRQTIIDPSFKYNFYLIRSGLHESFSDFTSSILSIAKRNVYRFLCIQYQNITQNKY